MPLDNKLVFYGRINNEEGEGIGSVVNNARKNVMGVGAGSKLDFLPEQN